MQVNTIPTKGNAIAIKKSLDLAYTGYTLLDKKRNVLIKEMMKTVTEAKNIQQQINDTYQLAYTALQEANISLGIIADLVESTPIDTGITIAYRSVMGVEIPKVIYHETSVIGQYDRERSNSKVDEAYQRFYQVKKLTIALASVENSVYRLANAIRKTQKRANALTNVSIPKLEKTYRMIVEVLEEKEREEFVRQKVIKQRK